MNDMIGYMPRVVIINMHTNQLYISADFILREAVCKKKKKKVNLWKFVK